MVSAQVAEIYDTTPPANEPTDQENPSRSDDEDDTRQEIQEPEGIAVPIPLRQVSKTQPAGPRQRTKGGPTGARYRGFRVRRVSLFALGISYLITDDQARDYFGAFNSSAQARSEVDRMISEGDALRPLPIPHLTDLENRSACILCAFCQVPAKFISMAAGTCSPEVCQEHSDPSRGLSMRERIGSEVTREQEIAAGDLSIAKDTATQSRRIARASAKSQATRDAQAHAESVQEAQEYEQEAQEYVERKRESEKEATYIARRVRQKVSTGIAKDTAQKEARSESVTALRAEFDAIWQGIAAPCRPGDGIGEISPAFGEIRTESDFLQWQNEQRMARGLTMRAYSPRFTESRSPSQRTESQNPWPRTVRRLAQIA